MKLTKLMWCAVCAVVLVALSLVGCEETEIYKINAPADLQAKIDSIAAARAGGDTGDTTYITITTTIVGAEDNSTGWWGAFSDYFTIPTNKLLHLEFINNGTGVNNWNNWNLAVANEVADRDASDYAEYFLLRSDAYGWGNTDFSLGMISHNYPDLNNDGDVWDDFKTTMQGAYVTLEIDHSATGNVYVTAKAVGTNGVEMELTYTQPVSATADINAFLVTDGSHFLMKKAYLLPSRVTAVEDSQPVSISISGAPEFIEIGNENFWGSAVATVTFADGSTEQADSTDLAFNVIPDMTTIGQKTVVVAYSKTKLGNASPKPVSTVYTLEVTKAIESIAASDINYYYYSSDDIVFNPKGIVVTATYADGSTGVLKDNVEFSYPSTVPSTAGSQIVEVTYTGPLATFTTTSTVTLVKGIAQVGVNDMTTAWWSSFSDDYNVPSGASKSVTLYCYSNGANFWNSPSTVLRAADDTEYAVLRMDNFGWGSGYDGNPGRVNTSDWNWDVFASNITGSRVVVTVTNNGDDTADIRYDVTYANGETHFQQYAGIIVDSSDLNFALTTEGAYLVIVE
jgi:hypothetical protein